MMISIAIIPDGNRRYASKNKFSLPSAYEKACNKVEEVMDWALETGEIDEVTVWGLSTENFRRKDAELKLLNGLYMQNLEKLLHNEKVYVNEVRVKVIGNRTMLNTELNELIEEVEKATEKNSKFTLNIALAYGGRDEIISAVKKAVESNEELTEESIQKNLMIPRNPDLVIRTSGVKRLSGYLSWQSAYSELYFSDLLWPEFSKQEFMKAVSFLKSAQRNYGK